MSRMRLPPGLVLSRSIGQGISFFDAAGNLLAHVVLIEQRASGQIRVHVDAPLDVKILRDELVVASSLVPV